MSFKKTQGPGCMVVGEAVSFHGDQQNIDWGFPLAKPLTKSLRELDDIFLWIVKRTSHLQYICQEA